MRLIRIGVASVSVKVGDFDGNGARLRAVIEAALEKGCHLLVTPELATCGYSLEDRIWWPDIAQQSWGSIEDLAPLCKGMAVFIGLPVRMDALMYNASALIYEGSVRGLILKRHLPTYSIFYEGRNWAPWLGGVTEHRGVPAGDLVFRLPFGNVTGEICEDLWAADSPARGRVLAGAEIVCNGSASPFTPLKSVQRRRLVQGVAEHLACVYAYANLVGCDSSRLVFDGGGFIATPDGIVAEGKPLTRGPWALTTGDVDLEDVVRLRAENSTWREDAVRGVAREGVLFVEVLSLIHISEPTRPY